MFVMVLNLPSLGWSRAKGRGLDPPSDCRGGEAVAGPATPCHRPPQSQPLAPLQGPSGAVAPLVALTCAEDADRRASATITLLPFECSQGYTLEHEIGARAPWRKPCPKSCLRLGRSTDLAELTWPYQAQLEGFQGTRNE